MSEPGSPLSTRLAKVRALAAERKSKVDATRAAHRQVKPAAAEVQSADSEDVLELELQKAAIAEGQRIRQLKSQSPTRIPSPTTSKPKPASPVASPPAAVATPPVPAVGAAEMAELVALRESEGQLEQHLTMTQLELQHDRQALRHATDQLTEASERAKRAHEEAVIEVRAQMESEINRLEDRLSQSTRENQRLEAAAESLTEQQEREVGTMSKLRAEMAAANEQLSEATGAEQSSAEYREQLRLMETQYAEQEQQSSAQYREQLRLMEAQCAEQEQQGVLMMGQLQTENEQLTNQLQQLSVQLQQASQQKPAASNDDDKRTILTLQQQLKKSETSRARADRMLTDTQEQLTERVAELKASKQETTGDQAAAAAEASAVKYREAVQAAVDGQHERSVEILLEVERIQQLRKGASAVGAPQRGMQQLKALQLEADRAAELEWETEAVNQRCGKLEKRIRELEFENTQLKRAARETLDAAKAERVAMEVQYENMQLSQELTAMERLQRDNMRLMKEKAQLQQAARQTQQEVMVLAEQVMESDLELEQANASLRGNEVAFGKLKQQAACRSLAHLLGRFVHEPSRKLVTRWHARAQTILM